MKFPSVLVLSIVVSALSGCSPPPTIIDGAGATFPYPIYSKWAYAYEKQTGVKVNYQSLGSGAGISQVKDKTVDFGASDSPLTIEELNEAKLVQFPLVVGGIVPVVHIEGVASGKLRLTPELLADIFLGTIKKWDDPALKAANPDLKLPAKEIAVVHRADGSGTTWIFTSYLAETSTKWKDKVGGAGKSVGWPTGIGGKGNEGVATYVNSIDGAIGYVEYAYALQTKMPYALLKNREGKYPEPTIKTFQAAAASADWKNAPGFYVVLVNQPGEMSWPITGASFILIHKEYDNAEHASTMLRFFDWCFRKGAQDAESLDYVPIPLDVVELVEKTWDQELRSGGKPVPH